MTAKLIGVDVGGTFTDLLCLDTSTGEVRMAKVPSTLENQAFGVLNAVESAGVALGEVGAIVHGTTTTTNAVLERKLAKTGLVTTRGFRDVLELGRRTRPRPYGLTGHFEPLIPRELRLEVTERMGADGQVVTPLEPGEVEAAVAKLLQCGCESLVIHFLHAYRNPVHELEAERVARALWPNAHVTCGHAVLSEFREYERGVTAAVNAAVQPVLGRYVSRLDSELRERGFASELLVMRGNGGTVSAHSVAQTAVNTVMSGPASGVMAAAYTSRASGVPNVITYDMGGTSCDAGLIKDGVPEVSSELEIEYAMPIHVPMVDVHTIGAGGGSLARIDESGLLRVGPESAGANPGPICYGRGGTRVTVTDANLLLGRLNPYALLGVEGAASLDEIRDAFSEQLGRPLGLEPVEAAAAVLRVANDAMAGALRMVSLSRGHDPRDFALFAFGGAGPLHAAELSAELGVPRVLVPARPGITNALGCLVADLRHDFVRTVNQPVPVVDMDEVNEILHEQEREGRALIGREQVAVGDIVVRHDADLQFQGQSHLLRVPIEGAGVTREQLQLGFEQAYWQRFEVELPEIRAVLVNLHTAVLGRRETVDPGQLRPDLGAAGGGPTVSTDSTAASETQRWVWFSQGGAVARILRREALQPGDTLPGPAVIEQLDSTTVLPPRCKLEVDSIGNLIIDVPQASRAS